MKVFDALQIRDINAHNSSVWDAPDPTKPKLIVYKNGLDKAVSLQLQGSRDKDFSIPVKIGNAIAASASMTDAAYEVLMEPWQYLRLVATCSQAPTSGSLDAWIE